MTAEPQLDEDLLQLATAFDVFNEVSRELEASYGTLETRMSELQQQLARSDEQRRAAARRGDSLAARLKTLLETLPGAVVLLDGEGIVREINSGAEELLGTDVAGRCWAEITLEVFERELSEQGDLVARRGAKLSLAQRELDDDAGTILLLTDVTEKREVEEVLARHKRLATLGEMVATLAHQVRTPVTSALLYASNALRPEIVEHRRCALIEKTIGCLHDLEELVNDMLRFARGSSEAQSETFSVEELFSTVDTAVGPQVKAGQGVSFRSTSGGSLLRGNRAALAGAIQNLVINALQAAGSRARVEVSSTLQQVPSDEQSVQIRISDNGPGIDASLAERIFEPFYTGRSDGTGLGLAVAQSIVRSHQGVLTAETQEARGACFLIVLPLASTSNLISHAAPGGRMSLERETA